MPRTSQSEEELDSPEWAMTGVVEGTRRHHEAVGEGAKIFDDAVPPERDGRPYRGPWPSDFAF